MKIDLTEKQFRRLLDLVYVGNWVMNSTRGDDRIREYDDVESTVFANCLSHGMVPLVEAYHGELIPSRAFAEGGIHEAIMAYEDTMFFEILAQELALRDMDSDAPTPENVDELRERKLIKNSGMVERCGLPGEKIYRNLEEVDPKSSYFSVILVKEKEFDE